MKQLQSVSVGMCVQMKLRHRRELNYSNLSIMSIVPYRTCVL
uniref:Uncharacterized protein n=1 Tax=Anguilla anguilla TaxID=7936 RepID=A0A0E9QPG7_ANGAN